MRTAEREQLRYNGLKVKFIAEDLGCSEQHVRNLIKKKKLEAVDIKTGKVPEIRVRKDSYLEYLESARV